jgi:hypothetical protein
MSQVLVKAEDATTKTPRSRQTFIYCDFGIIYCQTHSASFFRKTPQKDDLTSFVRDAFTI